MFRTVRGFASPGATGTRLRGGETPSPVPSPHDDSRHSPLHGEIPEKNRIRPRSLPPPGKLPPALSLARLPTGYRPDCPRPREGAGEERRRRGRGGGAGEVYGYSTWVKRGRGGGDGGERSVREGTKAR